MNAIIGLLILDTVAQLILCRFSLWFVISIIWRLVFCCRMIGVVFRVKKVATGEIVAFALMLLFHIVFSKGAMPWLRIILYFIFSGIAIGLEYLDELFYVYVIEDEED